MGKDIGNKVEGAKGFKNRASGRGNLNYANNASKHQRGLEIIHPVVMYNRLPGFYEQFIGIKYLGKKE